MSPGLYVHVPYCAKPCAYCDFYYKANTSRKPDYLHALLSEARLRIPQELDSIPVQTWYIGGGTPSLLSQDDWHLLLPCLSTLYPTSGEFTVEANPDDLTYDYLNFLRSCGVNRLSIGIQSFNDKVLSFLNRRHTAQRALDAFHDARRAGFKNISIDLIFGIPGFPLQDMLSQIRKAVSLRPDHLSVYHLTIEPRTMFGLQQKKGKLSPVSDEESTAQYTAITHALADAGYCHYEISNYCLPGKESVHNSNYWKSLPYIGLGPSAHSFDGSQRRWNVRSTNSYICGIAQHTTDWYETETLSRTDMYNEFVMTRLRTSAGIPLQELASRFGDDLFEHFSRTVKKYVESGAVLKQPDSTYRISETAWLFSDCIISDLFFA